VPKETKTKKEKAAAKKAADQKKAKEAKAAERAEKREQAEKAKAKERQDLIDSGALIVNGDFEYHLVNRDDSLTVEDRAAAVVKALVASKTPVAGAELRDEHGGGWPQYLSFFAMLKSMGLVTEYRRRGGTRGSSGVAYLATDALRDLA
jgi:hypothetical protein